MPAEDVDKRSGIKKPGIRPGFFESFFRLATYKQPSQAKGDGAR